MITSGLVYFLVALALGLSFMSCFMDPKKTGKGFLQLNDALSGVMILICLFLLRKTLPTFNWALWWGPVGMSGLLYLLQKDQRTLVVDALRVCKLIVVLLALYMTPHLSFSSVCTSAFFGGVLTYAMVLGHWYLVVPKLSEIPLLNAMKVSGIGFLVSLIFFTVKLVSWQDVFSQEHMRGFSMIEDYWPHFLVGMRVLWGYLIVFVMGLFTWKLVKIRSLQSATGVLYVMVFFVFIGELIQAYFDLKYGVRL